MRWDGARHGGTSKLGADQSRGARLPGDTGTETWLCWYGNQSVAVGSCVGSVTRQKMHNTMHNGGLLGLRNFYSTHTVQVLHRAPSLAEQYYKCVCIFNELQQLHPYLATPSDTLWFLVHRPHQISGFLSYYFSCACAEWSMQYKVSLINDIHCKIMRFIGELNNDIMRKAACSRAIRGPETRVPLEVA